MLQLIKILISSWMHKLLTVLKGYAFVSEPNMETGNKANGKRLTYKIAQKQASMSIVSFQRWVSHQGNCFFLTIKQLFPTKNAQNGTFMVFLTTSSFNLAVSSSQYTLNLNVYNKNNNANKGTS